MDDGQLVPRNHLDAMVQVVQKPATPTSGACFDEGAIVSVSGKHLPCRIGSICVHGDGAEAVATARYLRERLSPEGCTLVALPDLVCLRGS